MTVKGENAVSYLTLLSIIGRISPEAWDAIHPHGPVLGISESVLSSRIERLALNPQPLPPRDAFLVGAADLAHEIVRQALSIEARGESSLSFVSDTIDDWCGTPWPRKWPLPFPRSGPTPDPWDTVDVQAARLVAAIVFASVADRLTDDKFSAVFADGADRLAEAALNGGQAVRNAKPSRTIATGRRTTRR